MLKTKEILELTAGTLINDIYRDDIRGISSDSKKIKEGFLFVAIMGARFDGHNFIDEAIEKGAKAVIVQKPETQPTLVRYANRPEKVSFIVVKNSRKALARLANHFYGYPSDRIKVIGVTGTNGKTMVTYLIEKILNNANFSTGVIGTINYRFKDKIFNPTNTTPGPIDIQSLLACMLKEGTDYCIMEVSSHSLDQDRIGGINFTDAIFTNLTQDHFDYHRTLRNYFLAKSKLFLSLDAASIAIINLDDKMGRRIMQLTTAKKITYGIDSHADITAKDIKLGAKGIEFVVMTNKGDVVITTRLIGRHNVYNILAAIACCIQEKIDTQIIKNAIENFSFVPGRLELVESSLPFKVFVDYAHTEDALKNVLLALKNVGTKRILLVFGCGGDRDKDKRPKMGKVASRLANFSIITSDNPRSEDPAKIVQDIADGFEKDNHQIILDRKEAIKSMLSLAEPGDIVLIAGKGHETYQVFKNETVPFSDKEIVMDFLKNHSLKCSA